MNWPNNDLFIVLIGALVAIVVPWLLPRHWRRYMVSPIAVATIATLIWLLYEQNLRSISRPGDPLIRIDLFLIVPLIALDWLSAAASIALSHLRGQATERIPNP